MEKAREVERPSEEESSDGEIERGIEKQRVSDCAMPPTPARDGESRDESHERVKR